MDKKTTNTFKVRWNFELEMVVEIDHSIMTKEELVEINNFWIDADDFLNECDGNVLHAVLKRLAKFCFWLNTCEDYGTDYLIEQFDYEKEGKGHEGWPKMDGSMGIKILSCDSLEFHESNMFIIDEDKNNDK